MLNEQKPTQTDKTYDSDDMTTRNDEGNSESIESAFADHRHPNSDSKKEEPANGGKYLAG